MFQTIVAAIKEQRQEASIFVATMTLLVTTFLAVLAVYVFARGLWAYIVRNQVTEEGVAAFAAALLWLPIMKGAYVLYHRRARHREILANLRKELKPTSADAAFGMLLTSERFRRKSYAILALAVTIFVLGGAFAAVSGRLVDFDSALFSSHADISKEILAVERKLGSGDCNRLNVRRQAGDGGTRKIEAVFGGDTVRGSDCMNLMEQLPKLRAQLVDALKAKAQTDEKSTDVDRRATRAVFLRAMVIVITGALFAVLLTIYKHSLYTSRSYSMVYASMIIDPMNEELRKRIAAMERERIVFAREFVSPWARIKDLFRRGEDDQSQGGPDTVAAVQEGASRQRWRVRPWKWQAGPARQPAKA